MDAVLAAPDLLGRLSFTLDRGGVLVIPTESSYGLAVDPRSAAGVAAVYRLKERDRGKPLPVVAADRDQVLSLGVAPDLPVLDRLERAGRARRIDRADPAARPPLWPGPVTAVLPIERPLPATAGESTVAVRVPGHEGLRRLLAALGRPLTATSANRSGEPPVLDPDAAERLLAEAPSAAEAGGEGGPVGVVIDGGALPGGPPSTIVRVDYPGDDAGEDTREGRAPRVVVLREGAVRSEEVARRLSGF